MTLSPIWMRVDPNARIGRVLYGFGEVTSTMDVVWQLADVGAPHGTSVLADTQTKGRGRFGRVWVSPPGGSLSLSVLLRPPPAVAPLLSIIAGLAVRDALHELSGLDCAIKWPNDLQVEGRKLCGVLVEGRIATTGDSLAVLGVGLNLESDFVGLPVEGATSIHAETGRLVTSTDAAIGVLHRMDRWYGAALEGADIISPWRRSVSTLGRTITVAQRDGVISGYAEGVDSYGRLVLRTPEDEVLVLAEGDVSILS